ncbi:hypothetical protein K3495_g6553 [Podosphaera aphanis]|nr:hypothetical protein K3495_g6553 [Podosphaera aphanis]
MANSLILQELECKIREQTHKILENSDSYLSENEMIASVYKDPEIKMAMLLMEEMTKGLESIEIMVSQGNHDLPCSFDRGERIHVPSVVSMAANSVKELGEGKALYTPSQGSEDSSSRTSSRASDDSRSNSESIQIQPDSLSHQEKGSVLPVDNSDVRLASEAPKELRASKGKGKDREGSPQKSSKAIHTSLQASYDSESRPDSKKNRPDSLSHQKKGSVLPVDNSDVRLASEASKELRASKGKGKGKDREGSPQKSSKAIHTSPQTSYDSRSRSESVKIQLDSESRPDFPAHREKGSVSSIDNLNIRLAAEILKEFGINKSEGLLDPNHSESQQDSKNSSESKNIRPDSMSHQEKGSVLPVQNSDVRLASELQKELRISKDFEGSYPKPGMVNQSKSQTIHGRRSQKRKGKPCQSPSVKKLTTSDDSKQSLSSEGSSYSLFAKLKSILIYSLGQLKQAIEKVEQFIVEWKEAEEFYDDKRTIIGSELKDKRKSTCQKKAEYISFRARIQKLKKKMIETTEEALDILLSYTYCKMSGLIRVLMWIGSVGDMIKDGITGIFEICARRSLILAKAFLQTIGKMVLSLDTSINVLENRCNRLSCITEKKMNSFEPSECSSENSATLGSDSSDMDIES